jgi:hypothetical protein
MSAMHHDGSRALRDRYDSRRLADRLADPGWKQAEWARDVLPADDPARRGTGR